MILIISPKKQSVFISCQLVNWDKEFDDIVHHTDKGQNKLQ